MQFSGLIAFVGLLLIQSQTAQSTFVCNDEGRLPDAKTGYCMRPYPGRADRFLAVLAAPAGTKDHFTCTNTLVYRRPTESRWCCKVAQPPRLEQRKFSYFNEQDIKDLCYSRDGK